ncbi:methyltransferase, FxLD system [Herbidospora sp. RD11066]
MDSESLRAGMVDRLVADQRLKGLLLPPEVEAAMRTVPRELYTPGIPLDKAYENVAIITKRIGEVNTSSVSAPSVIAAMLGQAVDALGRMDGRHVLEIGSGGYNASLLRELVGPTGSVTTVDIDSEVTDRATACLRAAGYDDVRVVCADAEQPVEPGRRYDLIMVTVGAWDIPPAWLHQLTENGLLVVPLRTFGMTRSWALRRSGDRLVSNGNRLCGFVSMQGAGAHEVRHVDIADGVHLRLDEGQQIDPDVVAGLLTLPREEAWAGLALPPQTILSDMDMWLATRLVDDVHEFVMLSADPEAVVVRPSWRFGTPAVLRSGAFAYRSALRWSDGLFDLGVYAHGTAAAETATLMVEHVRAWVDAGGPSPTLHVLPANTPDGDMPEGAVLDKRHSRLVLAFTSRH